MHSHHGIGGHDITTLVTDWSVVMSSLLGDGENYIKLNV